MGFAEAQFAVDGILDGINGQAKVGLEPNSVWIKASAGNQQVKICFEAYDTIIYGQTLATVKGVMLRRKMGSAPTDIDDGVLIGTFEGSELTSHKTMDNPITDSGLYNDNRYYYRFFPYTGYGVYNYSANNIVSIVPRDAVIWGFHQDFENLDPDSSITYLEDCVGFTPAHHNKDTGTVTNGSWDDWEWLQMNKPYIVNGGGRANYALNPTNYAKRANGMDSDIFDTSGAFGCFSWIPKIYSKEVYSDDGNSRDVYFAMNNTSSRTSDFKPIGFQSSASETLEGIWLPMYYGDANGLTIAGTKPGWTLGEKYKDTSDSSCINDLATMQRNMQAGFSSNARFLGGPIMSVLRDILYMMYKSTNIRYHGSEGRIDTNAVINNRGGAVHDGQFYGRNRAAGELGRLFHSEVLGSYQRPIVDPYTVCYAMRGYMDVGLQRRDGQYGPRVIQQPYLKSCLDFTNYETTVKADGNVVEGTGTPPYQGTGVGEYGPSNTLEGYNTMVDYTQGGTTYNYFNLMVPEYFSNGYMQYCPTHLTPMVINGTTLTSSQKTSAGITNAQSTNDNMKLDIVPMSIKKTKLLDSCGSIPRAIARKGTVPGRSLGLCGQFCINIYEQDVPHPYGAWLVGLRLGGCSSESLIVNNSASPQNYLDMERGKMGSDAAGLSFLAFGYYSISRTGTNAQTNVHHNITGMEWGYACMLLPPVGYTPENVE